MHDNRYGVTGSSSLRNVVIAAVLLLGMSLNPDAVRSEVVSSPAGTGSPSCPGIHDLYKYEIKPWNPEVEKNLQGRKRAKAPITSISTGVTLTATRMPEIPKEPEREPEVNVSSVVNAGAKNGRLESDMINALADVVADRAQAELVLWLAGSVLDDICTNDFCNSYFQNACTNRAFSKDSNYPSLSSFLDSFRRDMETLPAAILCRNRDQDNRGYYLMNLLQGISAGIEPQYMIAGLAENEQLISGCREEYTNSRPGKQCSLYMSGAMMQAYLDGHPMPGGMMSWEVFFARLREDLNRINDRIADELLNGKSSNENAIAVIARTAVENHYLLASIAQNSKKLRDARTSRSARIRDVMPYATQLSRDLIALMEKSFAAIDKITDTNERSRSGERERLETVVNVITAGLAGRYSDAMLDLQKIINNYDYWPEKCEAEIHPLAAKYKVDDKSCSTSADFFDTVDIIRKKMGSRYCKPVFTTIFTSDQKKELDEFYKDLKACGDAYKLNRGKSSGSADRTSADAAEIERSFEHIRKYLRRVKGDAQDDLYGSDLDHCKEIVRMSNVEGELNKIREKLSKDPLLTGKELDACDQAGTDGKKTFAGQLDEWLSDVKKNLGKIEAEQKNVTTEGEKGAAREGKTTRYEPEDVLKDIRYVYDRKQSYNELKGIYTLNRSVPIVTALASAQSKDEIKKVLEDAASPLGGWRIKQERKWTKSITSLVGYQLAWEVTMNAGTTRVNSGGTSVLEEDDMKNSRGLSSGLLAPVGLDISYICTPTLWGLLPNYCSSSSGVLFSVIDLGNLVNTRITGNDQVNTADTSFKKVVSLGAYYHYSIPKTPAVWGLGYSYSPGLRSVDVDGQERDRGTHRAMFFISLDVSLFYFR